MFKRKKLTIVVVVLLALIAPILYFVSVNKSSTLKGYSEVEGYVHVEPGQLTCGALTPECGYCPGEVVDKSCFVKKFGSD